MKSGNGKASATKEGTEVRTAALNLLARREHSYCELQQKLSKKFPDSTALQMILDQLVQQGLQSDSRFAELFVRSRIRKGQGPFRIRQELQRRGVAEEITAAAFSDQQVDWFELAREVAVRRFGSIAAADFKERSKRARFLQYRGFDSDQIQFALNL